MKIRLSLFPALICAVALALAAPAMADNPTTSAYEPSTCSSSSSIVCSPPKTPKLPFTGIDVVPLALLGAGLLGAGVVARRRVTRGAR